MTIRPAAIGTALIILGIVLLLIAQQTLVVPGSTRLAGTIHNALHVPWSAVITLLLWRLTGRWQYAVVIALSIGLASEGVQLFTARSASLADVISDVLGIGLATALYAMVRSTRWLTRLLPLVGALMIAGFTLFPIVMVYASQYWLWERAPLIFDASDLRGIYLADITAESERVGGKTPALRITLTDRKWSGLHLRELPGPAHTLKHLVLELTVEGDAPLRLGTSMTYWQTQERGRLDHWLEPGPQELVIPVEALDGQHPFRYGLDLYIYGYGKQAGRRFLLHRVFLR